MATITLLFSESENVRVEYDINNANWRVSQIRCINNSEHQVRALILKSGVQYFTAIAPPNQTTSWNTTGLQLGWQPDYWNSETQQWEPGGIDMKDYTVFIASGWTGE